MIRPVVLRQDPTFYKKTVGLFIFSPLLHQKVMVASLYNLFYQE